MMYEVILKEMRAYIEKLKESGALIELEHSVSSRYEAASIGLKYKDKPVFFHAVDGIHRVIMNAVCSREMLADLLGTTPYNIAPFLAGLPESGEGGEVRIIEDSETKEVIEEPDLSKLPILRYFNGDGGAYITGGVVVAELDGIRNASIHRMMVLDDKRLAVRLVPPRHLYKMHKEAMERGEDLKVGIAIGVAPLILLAAATRVPPCREFEYASVLMNKPVELFRLDNGVAVPHAEIVIEGYISRDRAKEGPFMDITGTYDRIREEPVIRLTRIYHRRNPIYHAIVPSGAEHRLLMGVPYEPLIYRAVERVARVKNVVLTEGGCCYLHAVVQIEKEVEGEAKNAIIAAFAAHPSLKLVVVVDSDINIFKPEEVEYAIATRVRWSDDIVMIPGVRGSSLDPSSMNGVTTKVGIDATRG